MVDTPDASGKAIKCHVSSERFRALVNPTLAYYLSSPPNRDRSGQRLFLFHSFHSKETNVKTFILTMDDKVADSVEFVRKCNGIGLDELIRNALVGQAHNIHQNEHANIIRQTERGILVREFDPADWVPADLLSASKLIAAEDLLPTTLEPGLPLKANFKDVFVTPEGAPASEPVQLVKREDVSVEAAVAAGIVAANTIPSMEELDTIAVSSEPIVPVTLPVAETPPEQPATPPAEAPAAPATEAEPAAQSEAQAATEAPASPPADEQKAS